MEQTILTLILLALTSLFDLPDYLEELELSGQFGDDDDAEHYCHSALACHEAAVDGFLQLVADKVIACPENACTWHEREDATDDEDDDGTMQKCGTLVRREHHYHGGKEHGFDATCANYSCEKKIDNPSHGATEGTAIVETARHTKQDSKAHGADICHSYLYEPMGSDGVDEHSVQLYHTSANIAIDDEDRTHSDSHAEKHHQGIGQTGQSGKIVFGSNVAYAVGEGDAGDERDDGTDDHVAEMDVGYEMMADDAHQRHQHATGDVANHLRQIGRTHTKHIDPEEDAAEGRDSTIEQAAAKDCAEGT